MELCWGKYYCMRRLRDFHCHVWQRIPPAYGMVGSEQDLPDCRHVDFRGCLPGNRAVHPSLSNRVQVPPAYGYPRYRPAVHGECCYVEPEHSCYQPGCRHPDHPRYQRRTHPGERSVWYRRKRFISECIHPLYAALRTCSCFHRYCYLPTPVAIRHRKPY